MSDRIAVLGGGVMGEILAGGFLRYLAPRPVVVVAEKRPDRAAELARSLGVEVADPAGAVEGADVVVLVVKPQDVAALLGEVGPLIAPGTIVISIAAGIRTDLIEAAVPVGVDVIRAMPNTPARVDKGVTGISAGTLCRPESVGRARVLLESIGLVVEIPEALQDAVTAVSGSGPAYVFYLAEAMTAAAVELGLDLSTATQMVNQTILGAATLLDASGESATTLRTNVTSPNGTTHAAITAFDALGVASSIGVGMTAARDRSRELSGG